MKTLSLSILSFLLLGALPLSFNSAHARMSLDEMREIINQINDSGGERAERFDEMAAYISEDMGGFREGLSQIPGFMSAIHMAKPNMYEYLLDNDEKLALVKEHDNNFLLNSVYAGDENEINNFLAERYPEYHEETRNYIADSGYRPEEDREGDAPRDEEPREDVADGGTTSASSGGSGGSGESTGADGGGGAVPEDGGTGDVADGGGEGDTPREEGEEPRVSDDELRERLSDEGFAENLMHDIEQFRELSSQNENFADLFAEMYPDRLNEMFHMHPDALFEILSSADPDFLASLVLNGGPVADFLAEHHPDYSEQIRREYEDSINGDDGRDEVADSGTTGDGGGTSGDGGDAAVEDGGTGSTGGASNAVAAYCSDGTVLTIDPEMSASKYECNGRIVGYVAKSAESSDSNPFKSLNSVDGQ